MGRLATASVLSLALAVALTAAAGATVVDLTTDGAYGWISGAFFVQIDPPSAQGTGNFDPFVRIQAKGQESGYNTNGPLEFDTKAGKWTHILDLQGDGVPVVNGSTVPGLTSGVLYREFLLDINEAGSRQLLSLDAVQIFQSDSATNTGYPYLGNKIFDLGLNNFVILDYRLNPGSGQGDMAMYVPNSFFTAQRYVYLYSEFGGHVGIETSEAGFEEWGVSKRSGGYVPEPSTVLVILFGLAGIGGFITRKRS